MALHRKIEKMSITHIIRQQKTDSNITFFFKYMFAHLIEK